MEALILAAGFGTRLLPYTRVLPKPLFTLLETPVLGHTINRLRDAGCSKIYVNTHHLHTRIEAYINSTDFGIEVETVFEPEILETGGAVKNLASKLRNGPFWMINSDVISDIDLEKLKTVHQEHQPLATLALHDFQQFNKVKVDKDGFIRRFNHPENGLAFTGIQVISPEIFDVIGSENQKNFSIITVYRKLCKQKKIRAHIIDNIFWSDIGTSDSYLNTSARMLCAKALSLPPRNIEPDCIRPIKGDGSDRRWYRAVHQDRTLIVSDHGICLPGSDKEKELNAFVHIGNHLAQKGLFAPAILDHDRLSGQVVLEDLGKTHLADIIKSAPTESFILKTYQTVIDLLIRLSQDGATDFDPEWTCQTQEYTKDLILEKECQYFMGQFVNGYCRLDENFENFGSEFEFIAEQALENAVSGLMHRDFQSKNIMIKDDRPYLIDFQSARKGPLQYDLASLLIDPYTGLDARLQDELLDYAVKKLDLDTEQEKDFKKCYHYCRITRNFQMLGAFCFLTFQKEKKGFKQFILPAFRQLTRFLNDIETTRIPNIIRVMEQIKGALLDGKN